MQKEPLGVGIALLVASTLIVAPVGPILALTGAFGTLYGFLTEEAS